MAQTKSNALATPPPTPKAPSPAARESPKTPYPFSCRKTFLNNTPIIRLPRGLICMQCGHEPNDYRVPGALRCCNTIIDRYCLRRCTLESNKCPECDAEMFMGEDGVGARATGIPNAAKGQVGLAGNDATVAADL